MDKSLIKRDIQGLNSYLIAMTPENEEEQVKKLKEELMNIYNSL